MRICDENRLDWIEGQLFSTVAISTLVLHSEALLETLYSNFLSIRLNGEPTLEFVDKLTGKIMLLYSIDFTKIPKLYTLSSKSLEALLF